MCFALLCRRPALLPCFAGSREAGQAFGTARHSIKHINDRKGLGLALLFQLLSNMLLANLRSVEIYSSQKNRVPFGKVTPSRGLLLGCWHRPGPGKKAMYF